MAETAPAVDRGQASPIDVWALLIYAAPGCESARSLRERLEAVAQASGAGLEVRCLGPGDTSMADPHTLFGFLRRELTCTSAEHVAVVLAGHGTGLLGALTDFRGAAPEVMSLPGLSQALSRAQAETGRRVDLLVLDTCFMNLVEFAYELAVASPPAAAQLVVSVDPLPLAGLPYDLIADTLAEGAVTPSGASPAQVADLLVGRLNDHLARAGCTSRLACIGLDPDLWRPVALAARRLAEELLREAEPGAPEAASLRQARLHRVLARQQERENQADPGTAFAADLKASLSRTVTVAAPGLTAEARYHSFSMYLPTPGKLRPEYAAAYRQLAFARDSGLLAVVAPPETSEAAVPSPPPQAAPPVSLSGSLPGPALLPAHLVTPTQLEGRPA